MAPLLAPPVLRRGGLNGGSDKPAGGHRHGYRPAADRGGTRTVGGGAVGRPRGGAARVAAGVPALPRVAGGAGAAARGDVVAASGVRVRRPAPAPVAAGRAMTGHVCEGI